MFERGALRALVCALLLAGAPAGAQTLLPNAEQVFLDQNGAPLAGGDVYFYIPNTLTPKTTYSNSSLTTPNSNPVVLDAGGRAIIWGTGNYRELVKDQFGNLIWDQVTNAWAAPSAPVLSTRQVLRTGSGMTYVTPGDALQLKITEVAGGGGGGGSWTSGTPLGVSGGLGGTTSFNGITVLGGGGGAAGSSANVSYPGAGGAGGSGTPTGIYRTGGNTGQGSGIAPVDGIVGGAGGGSCMAGAGQATNPPPASADNSGGGGSGAPIGTGVAGAGGGGGECASFIVNNPSSSYVYTIGGGGAAGTAGNGGGTGGAGGSGVIIVDEFRQ